MSSNDENKVHSPSEPSGRPIKNGVSTFAGIIVSRERIFDVLSTVITAIFTVVLAVSTLLLWKETKDLRHFAEEQSRDMKASIAEAARSAIAMQDVAKAVADNAKSANESVALYKDANVRQMRAYLSVGLIGVINQNKENNYRFEVRMTLKNSGHTPAYKVFAIAKVFFLPIPLPSDFAFPAQSSPSGRSTSVLDPQQSYNIAGIANQIYSDEDVTEMKTGTHKRLYVVGIVTFEDAFGIQRHLKFSREIAWLKDGSAMWINTPEHNDSD